jgi:hypothetical protein
MAYSALTSFVVRTVSIGFASYAIHWGFYKILTRNATWVK